MCESHHSDWQRRCTYVSCKLGSEMGAFDGPMHNRSGLDSVLSQPACIFCSHDAHADGGVHHNDLPRLTAGNMQMGQASNAGSVPPSASWRTSA